MLAAADFDRLHADMVATNVVRRQDVVKLVQINYFTNIFDHILRHNAETEINWGD